MAITYTWKLTSLKVRDEGDNSNAVVQTYWQKTGTDDDGNEGTFSGATPFSTANMTGNFIPFAELTETQVLDWVKEIVVGSYEEHVNGMILKQIQEKANPIRETAFPWANSQPAGNVTPA